MSAAPVVFAVTTYNRVDYLRECLDSWLSTRDASLPWYVVVADDGSTDGTLEFLYRGGFAAPLHVIHNDRRGVGGQTNAIFELCRTLGFGFAFKADDDVVFRKPGWDRLYLEAASASGFDHLCHLNVALWNAERRPAQPLDLDRPFAIDASGACAAFTDVFTCMGCLFTFTPRVLSGVGAIDERNFPLRGDWHIDYSARCCRAGFNRIETFFDALGANAFVDLQDNLKPRYRKSLDLTRPAAAATLAPAELARRQSVIRDATRIFVDPRSAPAA
jgi:glycosyltransferase involved in cell wall biosynthesis